MRTLLLCQFGQELTKIQRCAADRRTRFGSREHPHIAYTIHWRDVYVPALELFAKRPDDDQRWRLPVHWLRGRHRTQVLSKLIRFAMLKVVGMRGGQTVCCITR